MHVLILAAIFLTTLGAMELFAYAMHRWVMHGPGWFLHASHHRTREGWFEWNDLYAAIFALPSIAMIWLGVRGGWGEWATAIGAGIAGYGAIYFGFHDWIVHRRLPHRIVPKSNYFKRIVQAHRLHHVVESKHGNVSFGFLWAPPIDTLKAQLRAADAGQLRGPALRN
ncbi:beta-carotene hydroxylase [Novosphingobium sp.]|uniref:beta-carotene hydroxylase n=1 Tax=Novosphingobium sp. TaxID=1874826 RepID=UPI0035B12577